MDKALFYHIADVIQEHRSWIEVIDTHDTIQWNYYPSLKQKTVISVPSYPI